MAEELKNAPQVIVPKAFVAKARPGMKVYTMHENVPVEAIVMALAPIMCMNKKGDLEIDYVTYRLRIKDKEGINKLDSNIYLTFEYLLENLRKSLVKFAL